MTAACRRYICPVCKEKTGVDILYGLPSYEGFQEAERGEVVLGGCCFSEDDPERACTSCGHRWRIKRRPIQP